MLPAVTPEPDWPGRDRLRGDTLQDSAEPSLGQREWLYQKTPSSGLGVSSLGVPGRCRHCAYASGTKLPKGQPSSVKLGWRQQ